MSSLPVQTGQRWHRLRGHLSPAQSPTPTSNLSCAFCFAAAQAAGICYVISTYASCSLEDIVATAPRGLKWFQLYATSDRQLNKQLVQRAEALGFKALVITVDTPKMGNRRCDFRNQLDLQRNLLLKDLRSPKEVGEQIRWAGMTGHTSSPSSLPSCHKKPLSAYSCQTL